MEEAFWAARQGDALLHTSFMADVLGAVLEVAANVVIDALIVGTTSLLAASVGITMGCTAVVLTGFVAGVAMVYTGVTDTVSEVCSDLANMLFPGKSSLMLYEQFGDLKFKYRNREFWCRGYYVDTVGKNTAKIQDYIKHQLEEDKMGEQLSIPYPGSPFTGRK
ncbi:Transposase [Escherichia coli]|nr:Transposase [Escherichia coli]